VTTATRTGTATDVLDATEESLPGSALHTLRRGLAASPEFRSGLPGTFALAIGATTGRIVVPIAVQQTIDRGLRNGTVHMGVIHAAVLLCGLGVLLTAVSGYAMNYRLFRTSETALAGLRVRAFRHVHDLSVLHQQAQRRGSLVSRVTGDVDEVSQFMQYGGIFVVVAGGQVVVATALMLVYSWPLALLVLVCFVPFTWFLAKVQLRLDAAYLTVRERVGDMLSAVSETVVGASVIKAHGVEARSQERVDRTVDATARAQVRAQVLSSSTFSAGELVSAIAMSGVVVLGVWLGVDDRITAGRLVAFLFLVSLFTTPVQMLTEVLNEGQTAIAGWRRVLGILDAPTDVTDPGPTGVDLPAGPLGVRFAAVSYAYPGGPTVLHDVDLDIAPRRRVAVVGETGSGKTTFAKLLTRLMDPAAGEVQIGSVPLRNVRFASLRARVVMVPQDGFLFDTTIAENVREGAAHLTDDDVVTAFTDLGLAEWLAGLPHGVRTRVGERGESLSVGERQLVAIVRAYVADPDLLVLDEATSAVDPATEVRLARALDALTRGRTTLTVAHRLSTAEAADEVVVVDKGRLVQRGPHRDLVGVPGVYADLYASWIAQRAG
jgi:putative ABC transport system ATP-binding protein